MSTMPTSTAGMNGHHHRHPPAMVMSSPDSAIGTASTGPHSQNGGAPTTKVHNAKSVRDGRIIGSKPDPEQIVCRRDYQHVVKETELFIGTPCTSRAQLLADSRLLRDFDESEHAERGRMRDTEWERGKRNAGYEYGMQNVQMQNAGRDVGRGRNMRNEETERAKLRNGGAERDKRNAKAEELPDDELLDEQCRRYYLYDTARHEYRLYYSREVRLRSASNLAEFEAEEEPYQRTQSSGTLHADAQRARGASSKSASAEGLLQHQFRPEGPSEKRMTMTTTFPAAESRSDMRQDDLHYGMRQEPRTPRMGAFERNSVTRKPLHTRVASDPPRRRQWSGGARRATEQKLQERNLLGVSPRKPEAPATAVRFSTPEVARSTGATAPSATTALLRDLLRPLRADVMEGSAAAPNRNRTRIRTWDMIEPPVAKSGKTAEMHQLLVAAEHRMKAEKPDAWSVWRELCCWRRPRAEPDVNKRTLPERVTAPLSPRLMRRLIGCVLGPLVLVLIGAVVVVVLLIYYA